MRCLACSTEFEPVVPHQRYCSGSCRVWAFRRRRAGAGTAKRRASPRPEAELPDGPRSTAPPAGDVDAFKEGVRLLAAFVRAIPDIAFIIDEEGLYVEVLAAPEREDLLYRQARAVRGRRIHDVFPQARADRFLSVIRKTVDTQKPQTMEYSLDVPAGRRWFEGRSAPLNLRGRKRMVVWVASDITDRKRAERAARVERERLMARLITVGVGTHPYRLTLRELSVIHLLADGKSDQEIADVLAISRRTVDKHVEHVLRKMGATSRTQAAVMAEREGLLG